MPRVSRNVVEFPVDGVIYVAKFQHAHADRDSKGKLLTNLTTQEGGKAISVQHITTCILSKRYGAYVGIHVMGISTCSLKEKYLWRKGIKLSFQRALVKMGLASEKVTVTVGPDMKERKTKGPITPIAGVKERYGKFMASFYRELRIRELPEAGNGGTSSARVEIPILMGQVVDKPQPLVHTVGPYPLIPDIVRHSADDRYPNNIPRPNQHGLGHCGMD